MRKYAYTMETPTASKKNEGICLYGYMDRSQNRDKEKCMPCIRLFKKKMKKKNKLDEQHKEGYTSVK